MPHEIEPDKGGIAGHALMQLAAETGDATYSSAALKIAQTLAERLHAYQALTLLVYAINDDGCPVDLALSAGRGGWQEDAHLDKVHNFVDALNAFPAWGN